MRWCFDMKPADPTLPDAVGCSNMLDLVLRKPFVPLRTLLVVVFTTTAAVRGEEVIEQFLAREAALRSVYVEFDWTLYHCDLLKDPFERENWRAIRADQVQRTHYEMWILRPHMRFRATGAGFPEREQHRSWFEGESTTVAVREDGYWDVTIDKARFAVGGPIPFVTPVELYQVFDIQQDLFELVRGGHMRVTSQSAETVVLTGDGVPQFAEAPSADWRVTAELDRVHGLLPRRLQAEVDVPGGGGKILWEMRAVETRPVGDTWGISEAVLAVKNTALKSNNWMVCHFRADKYESRPEMRREELVIAVPKTKVDITDVNRGIDRRVDGAGRVLRDRRITREQLEAERRMLAQARHDQQASLEKIARRKDWLGWMLGGSAVATLTVLGLWLWKRWLAVR